jgi:hypothetical protein
LPLRVPKQSLFLVSVCVIEISSSVDIWKYLFQEVPGESRELLVSLLKAIPSSVIGIVNFFRTFLPTEFSKQLDSCLAASSLVDSLQVSKVVSIHSKDKVKLLEV